MKIVHRLNVDQMLPGLPATGHVNGNPKNWSVTVLFTQQKSGFLWTTSAGNARRKSLHGPFPTLEDAVADAKRELEAVE